MRRLARLGAMLIEGGVVVVAAVGGVAAGGLRRLASIGEGSDQAAEAEGGPEVKPEPKP